MQIRVLGGNSNHVISVFRFIFQHMLYQLLTP